MMLPLPISPDVFLREVVNPALEYLPRHLTSDKAKVMLVAICLQESALKSRWQILNDGGKGPARGLPQFEMGSKLYGGGVWGLYKHRASHELLRQLCRDHDVNFEPRAIWSIMEHNDLFAVGCARALLWTDAKPLPEADDEEGSWKLYAERVWRPGAYTNGTEEARQKLRAKWARNHAKAREVVL